MNLEESNEYVDFQNKKNKKKKIILFIIIFLIIIIAVLVFSIFFLKNKDKNTRKIFVNGNKIKWSNSLFITKDEKTYVSTKEMANFIGMEYLKGEYKTYTMDNNHCYLKNQYEIITFSNESKLLKKYLINKTEVTDNSNSNNTNQNTTTNNNEELKYVVSSLDDTMELIELSSEMILENDIIYVPIEDIEKVFNVDYSFNNNSYYIYNLDYLYNYALNYTKSHNIPYLSNIYENVRALVDGLLVVSNSNNNYGVISLETGDNLLSYQYKKIIYLQASNEFFVYTDDTVGLLDKEGKTVIAPTEYDSLTVFDEINKLFLVKKDDKFGILNKQGETIVPANFSNIGIKSLSNYEEFELINSDSPNLLDSKYIIVVDSDKFGVYDIEGNKILNAKYDQLGYISNETDKKEKIKSTLTIPKEIGLYGLIIKQNSYYGILDFNSKSVLIPCSLNKIYQKIENDETRYYMDLGEEVIDLELYIQENFNFESEPEENSNQQQDNEYEENSNQQQENEDNEFDENNNQQYEGQPNYSEENNNIEQDNQENIYELDSENEGDEFEKIQEDTENNLYEDQENNPEYEEEI